MAEAERKDFTGQRLLDLVLSIERAVGEHAAGGTKLGGTVVHLCEGAIRADEEAQGIMRARREARLRGPSHV